MLSCRHTYSQIPFPSLKHYQVKHVEFRMLYFSGFLFVYFDHSYLFILAWNFLVDLDDKPPENSQEVSNFIGPVIDSLSTRREQLGTEHKESVLQTKNNFGADVVRMSAKDMSHSPGKKAGKVFGKSFKNPGSDSDMQKNASEVRNVGKIVKGRESDGLEQMSESLHDAAIDPTLPTEVINELMSYNQVSVLSVTIS